MLSLTYRNYSTIVAQLYNKVVNNTLVFINLMQPSIWMHMSIFNNTVPCTTFSGVQTGLNKGALAFTHACMHALHTTNNKSYYSYRYE